MVLKAPVLWARVRLTCPYCTTFCPTVPSHHTLTAYLVSGRAEVIPAWAPVLTLFWSLVTVFKMFSLCTTPHSCPFTTVSYFPPCSLFFWFVSLHSFLCVSDNLCYQPPLPGIYSVFFFFLLSSSKLTLVLPLCLSLHIISWCSPFPFMFFFSCCFSHIEGSAAGCSCHAHFPVPMGIFLDAFYRTDFAETFCSNTAKALAVSVHCPSLWIIRHLPSPAGAAQGTTSELEGLESPVSPTSAWQHQFFQHHSCCLQEVMVLLALFTLCKAVSQADTVNDLLPRDRLRGEKRLWVVDGGYRGRMIKNSLWESCLQDQVALEPYFRQTEK